MAVTGFDMIEVFCSFSFLRFGNCAGSSHLYKYLDREQREIEENDKEKRKGSKIIEKYRKNESKLEHSKIFTDNGQKISPKNAAPTHGTEVVT
jgi:hypothetical protein